MFLICSNLQMSQSLNSKFRLDHWTGEKQHLTAAAKREILAGTFNTCRRVLGRCQVKLTEPRGTQAGPGVLAPSQQWYAIGRFTCAIFNFLDFCYRSILVSG